MNDLSASIRGLRRYAVFSDTPRDKALNDRGRDLLQELCLYMQVFELVSSTGLASFARHHRVLTLLPGLSEGHTGPKKTRRTDLSAE